MERNRCDCECHVIPQLGLPVLCKCPNSHQDSKKCYVKQIINKSITKHKDVLLKLADR